MDENEEEWICPSPPRLRSIPYSEAVSPFVLHVSFPTLMSHGFRRRHYHRPPQMFRKSLAKTEFSDHFKSRG